MKLRFVSHAGFSVESQGVALLTDPWLRGRAFNRGWALLSPAAEVDWPGIDFVWFSHQHPDHLNFPTLKSIDPDQRARLTVLYQKHASLRIPRVLRGMGYSNVRELPLNRWLSLRPEVEIMCGSAGSMDSWIAIRADGTTILNLNDCVITRRHLAHIARQVGKVTVLLTRQLDRQSRRGKRKRSSGICATGWNSCSRSSPFHLPASFTSPIPRTSG